MYNPKISIIIPVYNAEKYLNRCLDSCVNQTMKEIEIIVVNDASPDKSYRIMQSYEHKYPDKVKCVYLKENVRQGGARNIGVNIACGEYVLFVDSDDWIELEMCEQLYLHAKVQNADIVYCNVLRETQNGYVINDRFPKELAGKVEDHIVGILAQQLFVGPWAHIIRRKIIIDNKLYFPQGVIAEDTAVTKLWDLYADSIVKIDAPYYVYCLNYNSTGQSVIAEYHKDVYECIKILYDNLLKCKRVNKYKLECHMICLYYVMNFTDSMCRKSGKKFAKELWQNFDSCVNYVCGDLTENYLWKYWFTPREKSWLLKGIDLDFYNENVKDNDIMDYENYYEILKEDIHDVIEKLKRQGTGKGVIWGKTNYAIGFNRVFPDMEIIDASTDIDKKEIGYIVVLRSLHYENVKANFKGKDILIYDLQRYLLAGGKEQR